MSIERLFVYIRYCEYEGIRPSFRGLKKFNNYIKKELPDV